jgi:DNA processing protein
LSLGVIIVETDVEGGTMHTAGFALKQRRHLACLVHPPKFAAVEKTRGNQKLIKNRASSRWKRRKILMRSLRCFFLTGW